MKYGLLPFWRRPLPIFIQVVGFLVILYALLILVGIIGTIAMSLYSGGSGSFELSTDFGRRYYENGYSSEPLLIRGGFVIFFSIFAGLIFFSGFRMAQGINEKGLAEYSSLQAVWIAQQVDIEVHRLLGRGFNFSLIAGVVAIAVYFIVRCSFYPFLKRILLKKDDLEADPSTSSG